MRKRISTWLVVIGTIATLMACGGKKNPTGPSNVGNGNVAFVAQFPDQIKARWTARTKPTVVPSCKVFVFSKPATVSPRDTINVIDLNLDLKSGTASGHGRVETSGTFYFVGVYYEDGVPVVGSKETAFVVDTKKVNTLLLVLDQWYSIDNLGIGIIIVPPDTVLAPSPVDSIGIDPGVFNVSVANTPVAQSFPVGSTQEVANFILDATGASKDTLVSLLPLELSGLITPTNLTAAVLYDGSTAITTGANMVNPTRTGTVLFTLDGVGVAVPKGTTKTLALKVYVSGGVGQTFAWGYGDSPGQTMTIIAGGTLTITDGGSVYRLVVGETSDVELLWARCTATQEAIDVRRIALELDSAVESADDLVGKSVSILTTNQVKVATAIFTDGRHAVSSLIATGAFRVPKGGALDFVVKGDLGPVTESGHLMRVSYDAQNVGLNGTYGVGVSSGMNVSPVGNNIVPAGVRIMRAIPKLAKYNLPYNQLANGSVRTLYRFAVTATGGDVETHKFTFPINVSGVTLSSFELKTYTDGQFSQSDITLPSTMSAGGGPGTLMVAVSQTRVIPEGQTRYFELTASVFDADSQADYVKVKLNGDAEAPVPYMNTVQGHELGGANFIWSPMSLGSVVESDADWANGNMLPGLPNNGTASEILTP